MSFAPRPSSGFTVIEVLIATALVVTAVAGFAHLAASGVARAHAARNAGAALALAQGKLEELRGAVWSYDAAGARVSDPILNESPADALATDREGWTDAFDAFGQLVATTDAHRAVYRRRWVIARLEPADADTLVMRVCVRSVVSSAAAGHGLPDACASTVLARKP